MHNRLSHLFGLLLLSTTLAFGSEAYFSPGGGIQDQIIRRINLSRHSIDIAMYSFTNGAIAQSLADARKRGVTIRLIRDISQSSNKNDENNYLRSEGIPIKEVSGKGRGIFHHKFAIFDQKILETGSFNWTTNGEKYNHENAIFFEDPTLVKAFQQEFDKLWNASTSAPRKTPKYMRRTNF